MEIKAALLVITAQAPHAQAVDTFLLLSSLMLTLFWLKVHGEQRSYRYTELAHVAHVHRPAHDLPFTLDSQGSSHVSMQHYNVSTQADTVPVEYQAYNSVIRCF